MSSKIRKLDWTFLVGGAAIVVGGCSGPVDPAAEKALMEALGRTSVTIFPAIVRRGGAPSHNADAAAKLAEFFKTASLADATVSAAEVPITGTWHVNQARMFRESAQAFAAHVKEHPIATQYALLPEYLVGKDRTGKDFVIGIHAYVVDRQGTLAFGVLLNSHWEAFTKANPRTVDDCTQVLQTVLRDSLKRPAAGP